MVSLEGESSVGLFRCIKLFIPNGLARGGVVCRTYSRRGKLLIPNGLFRLVCPRPKVPRGLAMLHGMKAIINVKGGVTKY